MPDLKLLAIAQGLQEHAEEAVARAETLLEGQLQMGNYNRRTRRKRPSTYSASRSGREQRRALEKLAGTPRGLPEHLLMAHGFSVEMLSGLVRAKLATVVTEPMREPRGVMIMVERIRITDAGRTQLQG